MLTQYMIEIGKALQKYEKQTVEDKFKDIKVKIDIQSKGLFNSKFKISNSKNEPYNILTCKLDISNKEDVKYTFETEEYDENKKYVYLCGLTGGKELNWSFNIKLKINIEENIKQTDAFSKFVKIPKQEKNKFEEEDIEFFTIIEEFIKNNKDKILTDCEEYMKSINPKLKKNAEVVLVFKIKEKESEDFNYLGNIDKCVKLYSIISEDKLKSKKGNGTNVCSVCQENEGAKSFNTGVYNVDQSSFIMENFKSESQYTLCKDCYKFAEEGNNFVKKNLNFYAFNKTDTVYHYIIPIHKDSKILYDSVMKLSELKKRMDSSYEKNIKKEKNAKKNIQEEENEEDIGRGIDDLFIELSKLNTEFLDFYYINDDAKIKPLFSLYLKNDVLDKLNNLFENMKRKTYSKFIGFNNLLRIFPHENIARDFYSKLLRLEKFDEKEFKQMMYYALKEIFIKNFESKDEKHPTYNITYKNAIRTYEMFEMIYDDKNWEKYESIEGEK